MTNLPRHCTCYYCGLSHRKVEAGGVWYCPNSLCPGPGGANFRMSCDSFEETGNSRHTVDPTEWARKALAALPDCDDPDIRAATFRSFESMFREADQAAEEVKP